MLLLEMINGMKRRKKQNSDTRITIHIYDFSIIFYSLVKYSIIWSPQTVNETEKFRGEKFNKQLKDIWDKLDKLLVYL